MIEMLTVIAIIGLLSAIIFPVFARVKLNAYKSSDISNMNSVRSALQLYRDDQGGYPPALLGYINPYEYRGSVTVVPANQYRGAMYPKRIDSLDTMKGSLNRSAPTLMVAGTWPPADVRPIGSAPIIDINGDGVVNAADDVAGARQAFASDYAVGPSYYLNDPEVAGNYGQSASTDVNTIGRFYAVSGYDVSPVKYQNGATYSEVHYTLFWSSYGTTTGSASDDPRQLGYTDPTEGTVVTWNTFFRDYTNNQVQSGQSKDLVLFLGGSARPLDSRQMAERGWRMMP